jgi:signal transduction histidine kinase
VALVVSLGLVFVSSRATDQVAENATNLHWTNSMLGGAGLARAASAQAVFFGIDEQIGVATEEAADRALEEARSILQPIAANPSVPLLGSAGDETIELDLSRFVAAAQRVIDLLETEQVEAAADALQLELEPALVALQAELVQRQALIENRIEETETMAGRVSIATQFLVTLLIPVAALLLYRRIVKRQVREAGLVMETRLRAEQELNRAKDEFIAGLSHEFRTPLTSIFGFSEVLIDSGLVDPDSSMELIGLINSESAELSRMVEDLLTAARLEAEALTISATTVDPAEIVESVLGPWRRSGHDILVDLAPAAVAADPLRLRQILRNLISNAVKHGGRHVAVVGLHVQGGYAWSVVDDGPGVSDEIAGRLFERTSTTGVERCWRAASDWGSTSHGRSPRRWAGRWSIRETTGRRGSRSSPRSPRPRFGPPRPSTSESPDGMAARDSPQPRATGTGSRNRPHRRIDPARSATRCGRNHSAVPRRLPRRRLLGERRHAQLVDGVDRSRRIHRSEGWIDLGRERTVPVWLVPQSRPLGGQRRLDPADVLQFRRGLRHSQLRLRAAPARFRWRNGAPPDLEDRVLELGGRRQLAAHGI